MFSHSSSAILLAASSVMLLLVVTQARTEPGKIEPLNPVLNWDYNRTLRYVYYADAASNNATVAGWNSSCPYCVAYGPASTFNVSVAKYNKLLQSFGYLGRNDQFQEIVIVFRGSTTTLNWITDAVSLKQVPYKYGGKDSNAGMVGMGFQAYYESLRGALTGRALSALLKQYPSYSLNIVGHSLGGAAASLCAVDLKVQYPDLQITLTTFGEPRTGNEAWAAYQNQVLGPVTRVVNNHDIVPHLPPHFASAIPLPPIHIGKKTIHLKLDEFAHECTEVWETPAPINGTIPTNVTYPGPQLYQVCTCDASSKFPGEDKACSDSVKVTSYSLMQHNQYMGVNCCKGVNETASGFVSGAEEGELIDALKKWIADHRSKIANLKPPVYTTGTAGHPTKTQDKHKHEEL